MSRATLLLAIAMASFPIAAGLMAGPAPGWHRPGVAETAIAGGLMLDPMLYGGAPRPRPLGFLS